MSNSNGVIIPIVCVVDCAGLLEIATTTNNALRSAAFDMLENGGIHVPTAVWNEFEDAYPDEAEILEGHVKHKIRNKPAYNFAQASLADISGTGFRFDPYGNSDWMAAAVAHSESAIILTEESKVIFYKSIVKCQISDIKTIT